MTMPLLLLLSLWAQAAPGPRPAVSDEYLIGPRDVVELKIYGEDALSRPQLTVDNDGAIDVPLVGLVKIAGLSARQVEQELIRRLSVRVDARGREQGYLRNPNISVIVREFRSQTVWVQGAVRNPGMVVLKGGATLMSALSSDGGAGPLNGDAGSYVLIIHAPEGQPNAGPILPEQNLRKENEVRVARQDLDLGRASAIRLRDGDTVFVPTAEKFFVYGEVKQTGSFVLTPDINNVLKALAVAGGATDRGAKNRITIRRVVNGIEVEIKVKETDAVLPGDTIIVPKKRI